MIKIVYKPSFIRHLKKLPKALQEEAKEKINLFHIDPNHLFLKAHKLKGRLSGRWSFSVNYQYRIVFRYESKDRIVLLTIGDHNVYK